ncbi:hypothetical protein JYK00_01540 [Thermosipho ferrireducens]|uniref:Uncharacterized protein n=1 Tax=Thermosipho ferrireducens TaxID=2571116 RepID=A0ABX7SAE5_9BACT|nr:hypothetical protein [Thermosipho ferrireducens]QTA38250.1 hypothetical protein JYK00_01540 [Thermosipho ferrireducens]
MNYSSAIVAMVVLAIAISTVYPTIYIQSKLYQQEKVKELVQLYSEDIFWNKLYGNAINLPESMTIIDVKDSTKTFYISENGVITAYERNVMKITLKYLDKEFQVEIIYNNRTY